MSLSGSKAQFITNMQILANQAEQVRIMAEEIATAYFKLGFNGGGANPIVDADATPFGLTAAKITSGITYCQQIGNLYGNVAVVTGDYRNTNDNLRTS